MIRQAVISDLHQILTLFDENSLDLSRLDDFRYQEEIQKIGFVLGGYTEEDFREYITTKKYFFVFEENREILGFIFGTEVKEYLHDEHKTWFDEDAKKLYYDDPKSFSIDILVIGRNHHRKSVGTQLLKHFEDALAKNGYRYLFSTVRILPVTNCASLLFHARHKFKRISTAKPTERYGMKYAASFLFFKQLTSN